MGNDVGMDLATLQKIYTAQGPFVTIYLDTTSAVEQAAQILETRWKNVLGDLESRGVDAATREALSAARGEHDGGNTRVLVASHDQVHLATWLPEPPPRDLVAVGPLPHLLPLIDALNLRLPHLVVLADRQGADVLAYTVGSDPVESASHDSNIWPTHHTGVGGWSSKRYDNTVQNSWEESAREVATLVENVAHDIGAELILASGDSRALSLLESHLGEATRGKFRKLEAGGGRHRDGSDEIIAQHVIEALSDQVAEETLTLLTRFGEERGRGEQACDGVADTVAALRMGQVGTLLLTAELDPEQAAWFGPEPTHLAVTEQELTSLGVQAPQQAPLTDVLVRAAVGTSAEVRVIAGGVADAPRDGVGALLRFTTDPGAQS
jgi:hypothetical protein